MNSHLHGCVKLLRQLRPSFSLSWREAMCESKSFLIFFSSKKARKQKENFLPAMLLLLLLDEKGPRDFNDKGRAFFESHNNGQRCKRGKSCKTLVGDVRK